MNKIESQIWKIKNDFKRIKVKKANKNKIPVLKNWNKKKIQKENSVIKNWNKK